MQSPDDIKVAIRTLSDKIRELRGSDGARSVNEANTKNWLIEPLMVAIGWDPRDPKAVVAEYRAPAAGQNPVDYALMMEGAPIVFVEAKALAEESMTPRSINQVVAYGAVAGVQWVVITNGDEYQIYRTDTTHAAAEKLLVSFRLSEAEDFETAARFLNWLRRDGLALGRLEGAWSERQTDTAVRSALETLLGGRDDQFNRWLARRTPGLTARAVQESLGRANVRISFPKQIEDPAPVPRTIPGRKAVVASTRDRVREHRGTTSMKAIAARHRLRFPIELVARYKGFDLNATVHEDGSIIYEGMAFKTLSRAAVMAIQSRPGAPRSGTSNGWAFWRTMLPDGSVVTLAELRDRNTGEN